MNFCEDFKHDLEVGLVAEKEIADMLENSTVEVKRDIIAKTTGRIFIEYSYKGRPSGISRTQANFYCFVVGDLIIFYETQKLKDLIRPMLGTDADICGGDNDQSRGILLPLKKLIP